MILKIFKSQSPAVYIALFVLLILLWLDVFILKKTNIILYSNDNVLFKTAFGWLENYRLFSLIIPFVFTLIQAFWLNSVVVNNDISGKGTLIPALIYVTLMSLNQDALSFNGLFFSGFFIIYALQISYNCYGKENIHLDIFKMAIVISIASLFYLPMLFYMLFVWIVMLFFNANNFRTFVISLVGFLLPYLYLIVVYFMLDDIPLLFHHLLLKYHSLFIHTIDFGIYLQLFPIILGSLIIISIVVFMRKINSRVIKIRKYIYLALWLFMLSTIIALFFSDSFLISLSLVVAPATIFFSDFLLSIKRKWLAGLIFFILIAVIIVEKLLQIL
jgi:hypothetical protein